MVTNSLNVSYLVLVDLSFMYSEKNIVSKANSVQHGFTVKRTISTEGNISTRNQAQYKKQKLNNVKKLP